MKLALLLFGISLEINKHWQYGTSYSVDYNNSYENYQKYIYEYFKNKGYDIDVYISTNILPENYKEDLFNKYKITPKKKKYKNYKQQLITELIHVVSCIFSLSLFLRWFSLRPSSVELRKHDKLNKLSILYRPLNRSRYFCNLTF